MKLYLMLFGLLASATPAFPLGSPPQSPACGVDIQPGMPRIIQCPSPNSDNTVCTIPLSCLKILKDNDLAAINVYNGEKIVWMSDLLDGNGKARKFKFKGKFKRVPKSSHQECLNWKLGDGPAFDNYPPQYQQPSETQSAYVSMHAPQYGCFKHSIHFDDDNSGKDDIDPHIIIGGQPPVEKDRKGSHKGHSVAGTREETVANRGTSWSRRGDGVLIVSKPQCA